LCCAPFRSPPLQALQCAPAPLLAPLLADPAVLPQVSAMVSRAISWRPGHALSTVAGLHLALLLLDKTPGEWADALARVSGGKRTGMRLG
jgi:hypothetical protein